MCQYCPEMTVCEDCEETIAHEHALLKLHTEGFTNYYKSEIEPESFEPDSYSTNKEIKVALTIRNIGKRIWPEDTVLRWEESEETLVEVGDIKPGQKCDVLLNWKVPDCSERVYKFRLFCMNSYFGKKFRIHIEKSKPGNIRYNKLEKVAEHFVKENIISKAMKDNFLKLIELTQSEEYKSLAEMLKKSKNNIELAVNMFVESQYK